MSFGLSPELSAKANREFSEVVAAALAIELHKHFRQAPLYAILDTSLRADLSAVSIAEALLSGGVRVIQYRHKARFGRANFNECCAIAERVHRAGGLFIVNDRADVAALCGADGVHLGQDDLPPGKARTVLGSGKIVGHSTHNRRQVSAAAVLPVDYIAIGPCFETTTKQNSDPVIELSLISELRRIVAQPIVAIGGITLESARSVLWAGADAVAVASSLLRADDIGLRVEQFLAALSANP